ncbi:glycosyltransferase [Novosphingobium nitrogenifigens DSM 19370]|uniref:Glycosyltransferase n=1 Tax=Novosphingobium nitrogenifigens DSM 19370 TaxID=983920 RepID=F1Z8E1_9SPHN|nr:glycosyltransferase family 4 protein [Novosphingobium nitrogenifigens]EGD59084.1 glycosyltransferase [Novosphingobium nitrogenifigens DSM 19370]
MTKLRTVHLLDDLSFGGVTRGLAVFAEPELAAVMTGQVVEIDPAQRIAPRFDADLILMHFTPRWNALPFLASLRLRNPGARIVHVEHSYTRAWTALHVPNLSRFRTMLRLWRKGCDELVAVSHGQAAWLQDFLGLAVAPRVIEPWGGCQGCRELPLPTPRKGRPLRLAAYGRFAEQKGFDILIAAMSLLPSQDYELDLGGFGPWDDRLRDQAAGLSNVRFFGRVGDVAAFLDACDVVVVPSRWEAFGQVVAEAKMAGRPVLVADVDGMPEQMITPDWIADCSSPEGLAAAIARIDASDLVAVGARNRAAMADVRRERVAAWLDLIQAKAVAVSFPQVLAA